MLSVLFSEAESAEKILWNISVPSDPEERKKVSVILESKVVGKESWVWDPAWIWLSAQSLNNCEAEWFILFSEPIISSALFFFFFFGAEELAQGLTHTRQKHYHCTTSSSSLLFLTCNVSKSLCCGVDTGVYVHSCASVCVHQCSGRVLSVPFHCSPPSPSYFFWDRVSHHVWNWLFSQTGWPASPRESPGPTSPVCVTFLHGCWESRLRPSCVSTLETEVLSTASVDF